MIPPPKSTSPATLTALFMPGSGKPGQKVLTDLLSAEIETIKKPLFNKLIYENQI